MHSAVGTDKRSSTRELTVYHSGFEPVHYWRNHAVVQDNHWSTSTRLVSHLVTLLCLNSSMSDLLSRCMPIPGSQDPTYGLSSDAICTQTDNAIMIDGWRSFPSGHSSCAYLSILTSFLHTHALQWQCPLLVLHSFLVIWQGKCISLIREVIR